MSVLKVCKISEAEFMQQVIDFAHLHGWRVAHFRPSRTKNGWVTAVSADGKGFPDLFMVRKSTKDCVAIELKVPPNKVTEEQDEWLTAMELCGIASFTWTPNDWTEIEDVLTHGPDAAACCDHGVQDGDWCEACNREYKFAAQENQSDG